MDAYEAIMTRRSIAKMSEKPCDKEVITPLLEAAVRAPTHFLTQPWRFVVLTGEARKELGEAWAAGARREGKDPELVREKPLRAPVIICVIEHPKTIRKRVLETEEHYATGAAIQNILLAAHSSGLAAMIRTGDAAHLPEVRAHLSVADDELLAAMIYIGYPRDDEGRRPLTRRTPAEELTEWRGW
jgi:nitroreductase